MGGGGGNESGRVSIIFGPAMTEPLATGASTALAPLCQSMTGNSITAAEMSVSVVTVFVAPLSSSRFFASFLLFVLSGTEYCSAVLEWVSAFLLVFFLCLAPKLFTRPHGKDTNEATNKGIRTRRIDTKRSISSTLHDRGTRTPEQRVGTVSSTTFPSVGNGRWPMARRWRRRRRPVTSTVTDDDDAGDTFTRRSFRGHLRSFRFRFFCVRFRFVSAVFGPVGH